MQGLVPGKEETFAAIQAGDCLARVPLCCKYPRGLGRYKLNMSHLCALAAKEEQ